MTANNFVCCASAVLLLCKGHQTLDYRDDEGPWDRHDAFDQAQVHTDGAETISLGSDIRESEERHFQVL